MASSGARHRRSRQFSNRPSSRWWWTWRLPRRSAWRSPTRFCWAPTRWF